MIEQLGSIENFERNYPAFYGSLKTCSPGRVWHMPISTYTSNTVIIHVLCVYIIEGYARFKGIVTEEAPASKRFRSESIFDRKAQIDPEKLLKNAATASSVVSTNSRGLHELAHFKGARAVEQRRQLSTPYPGYGRTVMAEDLQDRRDAQTDPFYAHILAQVVAAEERAKSVQAARLSPEQRIQMYKVFVSSSATVSSASSGTDSSNATTSTLKPYQQLPHPSLSSTTHHTNYTAPPTDTTAPKRRCQFAPAANDEVAEFWMNDAPNEINGGGNGGSGVV